MLETEIKMLAFDLDDTALDGNGQLAPETREAFIKAAEAGIEPVIASGRSFYSLPQELLEVPGIRYAICSNGANLFDTVNRKCLDSMCLEEYSIDQIVKIADDYKDTVYLDAFTEGVPHSDRRLLDTLLSNDKISEHRKVYLRRTRRPEDDIRGFIRDNKSRLDCMNYNVFDTRLFDELMSRLANEVQDIYFTSSIPELIEISYKDSGKAAGLKRMCDYLNIPIQNVAAFGNADNDAEMISVAGRGYAVANSSQVALDAADVVIGPCWENSVAEEIMRILEEKH
ncbi:MAG: HAD family hydrolase [Eubacterium sp.]|nr:HAD family hydrolase [Eubacterium sp.]